ncbi:hypothetical protein DFP73DRAFT_592026 [Morchella snyderi]|nr:hypothetical protein DFP73DRAFT_592026 [Morchella snyderi]
MPESDPPISNQIIIMPEQTSPIPIPGAQITTNLTPLNTDMTINNRLESYQHFTDQTFHNMITTYPSLSSLDFNPEGPQLDISTPYISYFASDPMLQRRSIDMESLPMQEHPAPQQLEHSDIVSTSLGSHVLPSQRSVGVQVNLGIRPSSSQYQEGGLDSIFQQPQSPLWNNGRAELEQQEDPARSAVSSSVQASSMELSRFGILNRSVPRHLAPDHPERDVNNYMRFGRATSEQWVHDIPVSTSSPLHPSHQRPQQGTEYTETTALLRSLPTMTAPTQGHPATQLVGLLAREQRGRDTQQGFASLTSRSRSTNLSPSTEQTNPLRNRPLLFPDVSQLAMEMARERVERDEQRVAANTHRASANGMRANGGVQAETLESMRASVAAQRAAQAEHNAAAQREMLRIEREMVASRDQGRGWSGRQTTTAPAGLARQGYSLPRNVSSVTQHPSVPPHVRRRAEIEGWYAAGTDLFREHPTGASSRSSAELATHGRRREERGRAISEEGRLAAEAAAREESRQAAADLQQMFDDINGFTGFECLICDTPIPFNTTSCDACITNTEFWSPGQIVRAQIAKAKGMPWDEYPSRGGRRCVLCDSSDICKDEERCRLCLYKTMGITAVWRFR